jgi:hypothetical protein
MKTELTQARLRELLSYDPETGFFTWRKSGKRAGKVLKGYVVLQVCRKRQRAHRLAWFYMYGEWPKHQIDHINRIRGDNRLCNLRDVPQSLNQQNQAKAHKNSSTGVIGVFRYGNKFRAAIGLSGQTHYLGMFNTVEAGAAAYAAAKRELHQVCPV